MLESQLGGLWLFGSRVALRRRLDDFRFRLVCRDRIRCRIKQISSWIIEGNVVCQHSQQSAKNVRLRNGSVAVAYVVCGRMSIPFCLGSFTAISMLEISTPSGTSSVRLPDDVDIGGSRIGSTRKRCFRRCIGVDPRSRDSRALSEPDTTKR